MKNLTKLAGLSLQEVHGLLDKAIQMKHGKFNNSCQNQMMINCFFEPSTRTQTSFQMAQKRLGIRLINFYPQASSIKKGESFYDTMMTFNCYQPDGFVIRSSENEFYKQVIGKIDSPLINAGDGTLDHPTQSLLDLYTIKEEFGHFEGLKICFVGDILHSRVAHSNIEIMQRLNMKTYICGPPEYVDQRYEALDCLDAIKEMDIIMLLRVQHERHDDPMSLTKEEYHQHYGMTMDKVKMMKESSIIMHPGPVNRGVEIADEVIECEKSRIYKQVENGVYVRMAVIHELLHQGEKQI